jgi:segregation and condensation protein A
MSYTIKLPVFEGPFDLLLFFIERDELDIYNIPIAKVTNDFLAYWREMQLMNIDMASEFIVVAATLMRIKSRLLLPRKEKDEEGNEIDPRKELVDRLLEYKRYKSVLEEMQTLENDRSLREKRGGVTTELQKIATKALVDVELESLTLFKLLQTYEKVLKRFDDAARVVVHTVVKYSYTIQGQKEYVFGRVQRERKCDFISILTACENRLHAIFTFLAILELIQLREITALIGEGTNNFWLEAIEEL